MWWGPDHVCIISESSDVKCAETECVCVHVCVRTLNSTHCHHSCGMEVFSVNALWWHGEKLCSETAIMYLIVWSTTSDPGS